LIKTLWTTNPSQRPLLVGPSEGMVGWKDANPATFYNFTTQWVRKVVAATVGALDVLAYHSYNNDALVSAANATFFLNQTLRHAEVRLSSCPRLV
jgi:hypothetical protein